MSGLLAATEPARTIVIERGGPAWCVPLAIALGVALVAALASYYATWRFKKADVNRENVFKAADLVDEAAQIASRLSRYEDEGGATTTLRLIRQARVRAEPVDDADLDDRFEAAQSFNTDLLVWDEEPGRGRYWLGNAIWTVRAGIVPYLSAPRLVGRKRPKERCFPTVSELNAMPSDPKARDGNIRIDALVDWRPKQD